MRADEQTSERRLLCVLTILSTCITLSLIHFSHRGTLGGPAASDSYWLAVSDSMNTRGTITTTIHPIRLTPDERGTIQRAVAVTKQTMSDFARATMLECAVRVLGTAQ